ncbi:hypothetical protein PIB30_086643 [Stylosanthes scabra]|uniref:Uncharacterized protein n=1 Tax=Stylosanthes scabra TaxID=79078 RepID=A0ABU6US07_9FABA|nr:hypothetical protein [Stylosanthes scabra]
MIFTIFFVLLSLFPFLLSFQLPNDTIVSTRLLDAQLQDSAFRAFSRPIITGVPYDAKVPKTLKGVEVSAIRLMSGSLWHRGVQMYKEFEIPERVVGYPFVERLVLVYQNLGNLSNKFYPLPGYTYLAPILGLLPYNGTNLNVSHSMVPESLQIRAYENPILIKFSDVKLVQQFGVAGVVMRRAKQGARIKLLEYVADNSEALKITYIGDTKLPSAAMIRTRPEEIENSYIC